jgi:hypothetical protein
LTACGKRIEIRPEIVEVEKIVYREVPQELLRPVPKKAIPETATYGELIEILSEDRASIDVLNGRLRAIGSLEVESGND